MIDIGKIFELLDDWRGLPSYKLEPRADIFFALYLPEIIKIFFKRNISYRNIIPEFPLLKKRFDDNYNESKDGNRSKKVDYAVFCRGELFLFELKTDMGSRETKQGTVQEDYMISATFVTPSELINDVKDIIESVSNKSYRKKYNHLISKANDLNMQFQPTKVIAVYIQPCLPSINSKSIEILTFKKIRECLNNLDEHFAKALEKWEKAPFSE